MEKGSEKGELGGFDRDRRDEEAPKGLDGAGALWGELGEDWDALRGGELGEDWDALRGGELGDD